MSALLEEYGPLTLTLSFQTLTDSQWAAIQSILPNPPKRSRGKPHSSWRSVMNSILYVLHTGGKWSALDKSVDYASKSSAHRWFVLWEKSGLLNQILEALSERADYRISFPSRRQRTPSKNKAVLMETGELYVATEKVVA